jgi:PAS domain S-box-containing protein
MLEHVFPGDSEMARRMREHDWEGTVLGPVEGWPQSLKTSVSTSLTCAFPIVVWWGPDLAILYNDEYRAILGPTKHPSALGERGAKVWAEIWDVIGPMLSQVMERAEETRSRDLLLHIDREGYAEEAYFSFSYAPIYAEDGKAGGIFCPVIETTEKVIGERRLRTLRDLAAKCKGAESEAAAYAAAAKVLAENAYDVPFAMIYRIDDGHATAELGAAVGIDADSSPAPRVVELASAEVPWSLDVVARSGLPSVLTDLASRFDRLPTGPWKVAPHTALVLPVLLPGQDRPRAILVAAVSPMRALDLDHRTFFNLVATQLAAGLADAQAMEDERRRAEALAEIDRAKTAFFSNVSHEFRTPLTLMLGPLEDVLASAHGELPRGAAGALSVAHRNSLRLLRLVNSLLDFSRIEAGRVEANYEPTDLAMHTAELASVFRSAIEKANLELVVDCPPLSEVAYVDRDMWEKIVLNLLSNAFKFTFEGRISVGLHCRGDRLELSVADTGVGIPEADLPRMFQRFHRVKNARSRTHEGSGIGLALVQELVKLHGGVVSFDSHEGRGTTFRVGIPLGKAHLPAERIGAARELASTRLGAAPFVEEALRWLPHDAENGAMDQFLPEFADAPETPGRYRREKGARILVADDNADMRDYLQRLLDRAYTVVAVEDGQTALEHIRANPPDLVVSDVMMPRLDGFELIAAIRAEQRTRALPVILLSARAGEEARIEGLSAGADDYLIKPFSARELLARVASQLELSRLRSEAQEGVRQRGEQFETLLNQAPLGVYLVDADFRILLVNPVALPVFGDLPGGIIGRDFGETIHMLWEKTYADEIVRIFRHTLETGEPYFMPERAEFRIDRQLVEYYEWRLNRITLPDGRHGLVCYFQDISAQVSARKTIEASREALRQADRRKDEFLATLAHELRNPLAPIRNSLNILRLGSRDRATTDHVREVMERQVDYMVRLVDDLMEVSRITRGKIELRKEQVDLSTVLSRAVETSKPIIDAANHELLVTLPDEPLVLWADPVRIAQVLANLLNNAAKYTSEGGRIWLTAKPAGSEVVVSVRDSGAGIPADMLPKVFDLFIQGDRTYARTQGGLGIGLTLVQALVNMHGGTVEAHSDGHGCGSEFVVRLPLAARRRAAHSSDFRDDGPRTLAPQRILVVDDNVDSAESLTMLLEYMGAEVCTAGNGLAALEALKAFRPSVVVLDIGLPGMDGYEIARRIRRDLRMADVALIALTGWGQEDDRRRSKEVGIDHHLIKPVDLRALERVLATVSTKRESVN